MNLQGKDSALAKLLSRLEEQERRTTQAIAAHVDGKTELLRKTSAMQAQVRPFCF